MAFESSRFIAIRVPDLGPVARGVMEHFSKQGYEVEGQPTGSGAWHISLSKGGVFKMVLGMKTALNIDLEPTPNGTMARAGVGIFGLQAVPTAIAMLVFWPVMLAQLWGIVQQSKLDGEALAVIEQYLATYGKPGTAPPKTTTGYCPNCGVQLQPPGRFCASCGTKVAG